MPGAKDDDRLGAQLQILCEHLPFDVWVRDRDDRCIYANEAARRRWPGLVGSRPEDSGQSPDVVAIWRANNDRALDGEVVRGDVTYTVDGVEGVYFNLIAPVHVGDAIEGTVGVNVDISAQRRAEKSLQERDAMLRSVFDTSRALMGVREIRDDDIVHVADNPACARTIWESTPEALAGKSERELGVPPELVANTIATARRARRTGAPQDFEVAFPTAAGVRSFAGKLAALDVPGSERYFFVAEDVTELRGLQDSLIRAERLASLGVLAASIAHEIKNPATYVLMNLDHALRLVERTRVADPSVPLGAVADDLRSALHGVERIGEMVRDLQRLARPTTPELHAVDTSDIVRSVVALTRGATLDHADLEVDLAALRHAMGDGVRLAQVLINLVTNASQAIAATADPAAPPRRHRIVVRTRDTAFGVAIEVEDDGPGIAPAVRERLFEPFVSTHGRVENTGLGLHIARTIVQGFGGTLGVSDRAGGGCVFVVELRAAPLEAVTPPP